jgi:simple sugar transport system ATP-binding protein
MPRAVCAREQLAELMVGEASGVVDDVPAPAGEPGETVMEVRDLHVTSDRRLSAIRGVSLTLRRGQIVGIAGVAGNGQGELAEALAGMRPHDAGTITVDGLALKGGARAFLEAGVAYIPEDRRGVGMVPSEPIWRNAVLKGYRYAPVAHGPLMRSRVARRLAAELAAGANLSTDDVDTPVEQLSGGNAQKLLTARELAAGRNVIVAVNPTQGLDVGAVGAVWQALLRARESAAVLLISSDLDEILRLSDRVSVLYEGRIVGDFPVGEAGRERIGLLIAGGQEAAVDA